MKTHADGLGSFLPAQAAAGILIRALKPPHHPEFLADHKGLVLRFRQGPILVPVKPLEIPVHVTY